MYFFKNFDKFAPGGGMGGAGGPKTIVFGHITHNQRV